MGGQAATMMALNKLAPGVGDRYLAKTGYDSQFTDRPIDPDRRDNLFEPVPGDHGAHGIFDDRAKPRSVELEAAEHFGWLAAAAGGVVALAAGAFAWAARSGGR